MGMVGKFLGILAVGIGVSAVFSFGYTFLINPLLIALSPQVTGSIYAIGLLVSFVFGIMLGIKAKLDIFPWL